MQFVMYTGKLHTVYRNIHFFITYDIYTSEHAFPLTIHQNIRCKKLQLLEDFVPRPITEATFLLDHTWGLQSPRSPNCIKWQ